MLDLGGFGGPGPEVVVDCVLGFGGIFPESGCEDVGLGGGGVGAGGKGCDGGEFGGRAVCELAGVDGVEQVAGAQDAGWFGFGGGLEVLEGDVRFVGIECDLGLSAVDFGQGLEGFAIGFLLFDGEFGHGLGFVPAGLGNGFACIREVGAAGVGAVVTADETKNARDEEQGECAFFCILHGVRPGLVAG